jgi:hypothetical protein
MNWLGGLATSVGLVSGILGLGSAAYRSISNRRDSSVFVLYPSTSDDALIIDFENSGVRTLYRVTGILHWREGGVTVTTSRFTTALLTPGGKLRLPIPTSSTSLSNMTYAELSQWVEELLLEIEFRLHPRQMRPLRRGFHIGLASLAQEGFLLLG